MEVCGSCFFVNPRLEWWCGLGVLSRGFDAGDGDGDCREGEQQDGEEGLVKGDEDNGESIGSNGIV